MTVTPEIESDAARRLAVADAERELYSASGSLGMARRWQQARKIPELEKRLTEAKERLAKAKKDLAA